MSPELLRILHLRTVSGTGGGPEKTILNSCCRLRELGHVAEAFYILDRRHDTGEVQSSAESLGLNLHVSLESSPISLHTLRRLYRVLREGKYHIVHTHDYKANVLAWLMRPVHRYNTVATAHGYNGTTLREAAYYSIERALFRYVDAVITPSADMHRLLRGYGVPANRLHVIHNGVLPAQRVENRRQRNGSLHLLYLGRLSSEKDPVNVVHAAALLLKRGHNVHVTLAGDGPEHDNVKSTGHRLGLGDRMNLPGYVDDPSLLLNGCDILVNPSRTECMPNAVLEAMAARLPVVATDVGGLSEMIRHDIDGVLCPPGDPEALAGSIERLANDREAAGRLACSAQRRVLDKFSFDRRMVRVIELYRQVLSAKAGDRK